MIEITAIFLVLTTLLAYFNYRFIGLPITIGVMATSLIVSLIIIFLNIVGLDFGLYRKFELMLSHINFSEILMNGMLSFLLFAGALHIDINQLKNYKWQVLSLAFISTFLSTIIIGITIWYILPWIGLKLPFLYCLLFGALISPTDPIAVIGILKSAGVPKNLETMIAGESLFNDGIGVVVFSILLSILLLGKNPSVYEGSMLLIHEAGGGLIFGLALGYVTFLLLKSIDNYQLEVMLTLACVMGGYVLASKLHVSGPLAMVIAGLYIGSQARKLAMSKTTRVYLDMFWETLDGILNAILFVLIGMEVMLIAFDFNIAIAALISILLVLIARALTVWMPVRILKFYFNLPKGAGLVLTWGGIRGGISVALALSLPLGMEREIVLALTYCVVISSILIQGLTIGKLARKIIQT